MDLKSTYPFWPILTGLPSTYPPLSRNLECEVIVLGAGITGALVADQLTKRGISIVLLDRRDVGQGSTSATTGLLQYEIDVPLTQLIEKVGRNHAMRAYQLCLKSISDLEQLAQESSIPSGFDRKISLYAASCKEDVQQLRAEYTVRRDCGIELEILEGPTIKERFGLDAPALLISRDAAVCNAFALTHGLLQNSLRRGAQIYDRTEATRISYLDSGVRIETNRGPVVMGQQIVFANGYEAQSGIQENIVNLKSTYALVTQPLEDLGTWQDEWIYWESARPYLYLRTTADRRLLVGGEDDDFRNPAKRDARVPQKSEKLMQRLRQMFPTLPLEIEYSWAGTFGETQDGLAYIGRSPEQPRALYALGYGGNGITFSMIAAQILADLLCGITNSDAEIFRFGR